MNERVVVTGANGFVGRYVCRKLIASGFLPIAGLRDLETWPELRHAIPGLNEVSHLGDLSANPNLRDSFSGASVVMHLAARVHVTSRVGPRSSGGIQKSKCQRDQGHCSRCGRSRCSTAHLCKHGKSPRRVDLWQSILRGHAFQS